MTLYEPVTIAWLFITVLILLFSGTLGTSVYNGAQRACEHRNVVLLQSQAEGPLERCTL